MPVQMFICPLKSESLLQLINCNRLFDLPFASFLDWYSEFRTKPRQHRAREPSQTYGDGQGRNFPNWGRIQDSPLLQAEIPLSYQKPTLIGGFLASAPFLICSPALYSCPLGTKYVKLHPRPCDKFDLTFL